MIKPYLKEPYFFWCHTSNDCEPILYAIRPADDTVWFLDNHNEWKRSTLYTHDQLTRQFNNPSKGNADRFTAVQPYELIGTTTPKLPEYQAPSESQFIPPPDLTKAPCPKVSPYVSGSLFENPFKSPFDPQEIAKDIWDAGNAAAFRDIAKWLRENLELVEARLAKIQKSK